MIDESGIFLIRQGNALHLDYLYIISKCVGLLSVNGFCVIHPTPHALETGGDECVFVCVCKQEGQILFAGVFARSGRSEVSDVRVNR